MEFVFRLFLEGLLAVVVAVHGWLYVPGSWTPAHEILRVRNGWIGAVATVMFVVGGLMPLFFLSGYGEDVRWLSIGVACGAAVMLPYFWICLVTLPFGLGRYREYWLFYRLHYGIGPKRVLALCLPFAVLGMVSMAVVLHRLAWPLL